MKKLEEALDAQHRLIQKMQTAGLRPALDISSYTSSLSHPHHEAFLNYVHKGIEPTWTSKSMNASEGTEGGYLIPHHGVSDHIHSLLKEESFFRKVARVTTILNDAFEMLIDKGEAAVGWAQERDPREETTTPELSNRIPIHELYARPRTTQRLLDDAFMNVESWLAEKISAQIAEVKNISEAL